MKDMLERLADVRAQIAKRERLRDSAKSKFIRWALQRIIEHQKDVASELEQAIHEAESDARGS
ncbi:hypothetical protein [Bradyrhizobium sp. B117]|uniref:hypothetical protein n=1 Tax=Bradyrhizobium sp. B117 TaxID=3140246 RepID=UPI003183AFDA